MRPRPPCAGSPAPVSYTHLDVYKRQLRGYAGLSKEIVVIGAFNRLEVWDAATWAEYSAAQEEAFAALDEGAPAVG